MALTRTTAVARTIANASLVNENFTNCGKELQPKTVHHNIKFYKDKIPKKTLCSFESLTGWSVSTSSLYLEPTIKVEENYSIRAQDSSSNHYLSKSDMAFGDLSEYTGVSSGVPTRGTLSLYFRTTSGTMSYIKIRVGNDSSNYLETTFTFDSDSRDSVYNKFAKLNFDLSTGAETGSVDWTSNMDYLYIYTRDSTASTRYYYYDFLHLPEQITGENKIFYTDGTLYYDGTAYTLIAGELSSYTNKLITATLSGGSVTLNLRSLTYRIQSETELLLGHFDAEGTFNTIGQGNTLSLQEMQYIPHYEQVSHDLSSTLHTDVLVDYEGSGYLASVTAFASAGGYYGFQSYAYIQVEIDGEVYIEEMDLENYESSFGAKASSSYASFIPGFMKFNISLKITVKLKAYGDSGGGATYWGHSKANAVYYA